ncbi:MAG: DUF4465 domain-containing protein [Rikenellaceae bacterium]
MKKVFLLLSMAILTFSCSKDEEVVTPDNEVVYATLTFEDDDYTGDANYLGESSWSSLIDIEYGGELLYALDEYWTGYSEYAWYDGGNTELASEVISAYGSTAFWNGGIAISNYYFEVSEANQATYLNQLSVPCIDSNGNSGYNGSENFAVVYDGGYLYFGDSVARTIDHLYVAPTSFWLSMATYGDYGTSAMTNEDYFKIIATSVDAEGEALATVELYLAQDGEMATSWQKWDLSTLGEVSKVVFSADGSVVNEYGPAMPNYFAIDDVTVVIE